MEENRDPRVRFAAERTLLAWVRTGLAMMGFGFVVARFGWFLREFALQQQRMHSPGWSLVIGVILIVMGVVINLLAGLEHSRFLRRFDRGEPYQPPTWSMGIIIAVILAILGVVMAVSLVTLAVG